MVALGQTTEQTGGHHHLLAAAGQLLDSDPHHAVQWVLWWCQMDRRCRLSSHPRGGETL